MKARGYSGEDASTPGQTLSEGSKVSHGYVVAPVLESCFFAGYQKPKLFPTEAESHTVLGPPVLDAALETRRKIPIRGAQ